MVGVYLRKQTMTLKKDIKEKYFTNADYSKFTRETLDEKIKQK